jgi:hypothetical protein
VLDILNMKATLLIPFVSLSILCGCDMKVVNPPDKVVEKKDTTIVNPPATEEKKVEKNTTIVNPPAKP